MYDINSLSFFLRSREIEMKNSFFLEKKNIYNCGIML